jgi:hypothetical protein
MIYVHGVGVWESPAAAAEKPAAALLPPRMRGRASPLTLMLAEVVEQATRAAQAAAASLPSVFGSAYGEMSTTLALLQQLLAAGGQLSPAKFQASVHNTAAAQLSIALKNPSFTTSIAAGHDTVAMSLLEASAWLAKHPGQVLVACADEAPTSALQPGATYPPLAAAFVLDNVAARGLSSLELVAPEEHGVSETWASNPVAPAVAIARAVLARESAIIPLNNGYRLAIRPCEERHE